jgi:hypothetical protein
MGWPSDRIGEEVSPRCSCPPHPPPQTNSLSQEGDTEDPPPEPMPLTRKSSRRHSVRISRTQLEGDLPSPGDLMSSLSFRTDASEASLASEDCWAAVAVTVEHKSERIEF